MFFFYFNFYIKFTKLIIFNTCFQRLRICILWEKQMFFYNFQCCLISNCLIEVIFQSNLIIIFLQKFMRSKFVSNFVLQIIYVTITSIVVTIDFIIHGEALLLLMFIATTWTQPPDVTIVVCIPWKKNRFSTIETRTVSRHFPKYNCFYCWKSAFIKLNTNNYRDARWLRPCSHYRFKRFDGESLFYTNK